MNSLGLSRRVGKSVLAPAVEESSLDTVFRRSRLPRCKARSMHRWRFGHEDTEIACAELRPAERLVRLARFEQPPHFFGRFLRQDEPHAAFPPARPPPEPPHEKRERVLVFGYQHFKACGTDDSEIGVEHEIAIP